MLDKVTIHKVLNPWVTMVETLSDLEMDSYFHLKVPNYVFVLSITDDGMIPLVTQYRIPLKRNSLELPAGLVDNGHSPRDTAINELLEETGIQKFKSIIAMPPMVLDSGRIENLTFGYVFTGIEPPSMIESEDAELSTTWVSSSELVDLAMSGKIDHLGQVALILWAARLGYL